MSTEEKIFEQPHYVKAARAAGTGDAVTLKNLIGQGIDVNYEGRETKTPWGKDTVTLLLWAVLSESIEGTEILLQAGADPNKPTHDGMAPLIIAAGLKNDAIFKQLLIKYKADPNRVVRKGIPNSPLTIVLKERKNLGELRFDRAAMLIKYGADVNLDLDRGDTATSIFSRLGDWRAVHWLLKHGANHEARDSIGATMMCSLRRSYRVNNLGPSEAYDYRERVRDWLLLKGVIRSRIDPLLHPNPKCDD